MSAILTILFGILSLVVIYTFVSAVAYVLAVAFKSRIPVNIVVGAAVGVQLLISLFVFVWFIATTFTLFKNGEIIFGLVFFFFLGGLIMWLYSTLYSLLAAIPVYFLTKIDTKLNDRETEALDSSAQRVHVESKVESTKHTQRQSDKDDRLEVWNVIKSKEKE